MFVDACAIISIFTGEDTACSYEDALVKSASPWTSILAAWEAIIILSRSDQLNCPYSVSELTVREWLLERNIALRETHFTSQALSYAVAAAQKHGIGKKGLINFDCFHYAYAKADSTSLLTLDKKLRETDVLTLP